MAKDITIEVNGQVAVTITYGTLDGALVVDTKLADDQVGLAVMWGLIALVEQHGNDGATLRLDVPDFGN